MNALIFDVRFALRALRRRPGFLLAVVLTLALGAQSADVLSLILSETAIAVAVGIGLGVAGAALTTKLLTQWLYNVGSFDPFSFGAAIVVVALMSAVAALAPSWRAVRINPVQAIKTAE